MPIGIRPINDFAFKKVFGSPENHAYLVSLLNAILDLSVPIAEVTIQNPFNPQEFEDDKLSVLDIRASDPLGRIYDVEIQLSHSPTLIPRLVFYGCELYAGQLKSGCGYEDLHPVFTICLLDGKLWNDTAKLHHAFAFRDGETGKTLENTLAIHILELGKYNLDERDVPSASLLDCWLFWMKHAQEYEAGELRRLFPQEPIRGATGVIQKISEKTEDRTMYDLREKALRDRKNELDSARREGEILGRKEGEILGRKEGEILGRKEGEIQGRKEGEILGRKEGEILGRREGEILGRKVGVVQGRKEGEIQLVHILQDWLGQDRSPESELGAKSLEELQVITSDLRKKLPNRG